MPHSRTWICCISCGTCLLDRRSWTDQTSRRVRVLRWGRYFYSNFILFLLALWFQKEWGCYCSQEWSLSDSLKFGVFLKLLPRKKVISGVFASCLCEICHTSLADLVKIIPTAFQKTDGNVFEMNQFLVRKQFKVSLQVGTIFLGVLIEWTGERWQSICTERINGGSPFIISSKRYDVGNF
jgi:hypothetical protein